MKVNLHTDEIDLNTFLNMFLQFCLLRKKLKVKLSSSKKVYFICFNGRPLNMIKTASYFMLKAFFVLKIYNFFPRHFGHVGKRPDKKTKVNFKIDDVTG